MTNFFNSTPGFLKPFQNNLNHWVPTAPKDAIWGGFKSNIGSAVVTTLLTKGNGFSVLASQPLATVASFTYAIALASIKYLEQKQYIAEQPRTYVQLGCTATGFIAAHLVADRIGVNMSFWWSLTCTAAAYVLLQPSTSPTLDQPTPLFLNVVV